MATDPKKTSPQPAQQQEPVPAAMKTVIEAMQADPDYAWSWHCNVAMAFVDAGGDHYTGNQGAARFMKMLANVEPAYELPSPQPAQQQEPDAIVTSLTAGPDGVARSGLDRELPLMAGVYLTPQPAQRKPLTDDPKNTERPQSRAHLFPAEQVEAVKAQLQEAVEAHGLTAKPEPTGSMGMPISCGKPLCSPGDHHPLCKLAEQPAPAQGWKADVQKVRDALDPEDWCGDERMIDVLDRALAQKPCCSNMAAGTSCLADPHPNCPLLAAAPQPAMQEPVAWRWSESNGQRFFDWTTDWSHHDKAKSMGFPIEYAYASPQPAQQQEHVTTNSLARACNLAGVDCQTFLKIKAYMPVTPQPAQQDSTCSNALRAQGKAYPRTCKKCGRGACIELAQQALDKKAEQPEIEYCTVYRCAGDCGQPHDQKEMREFLDTTPQPPAQQEPLTEKEIREWWASENGLEDCDMCKLDYFVQVVRAVEAKRNIKDTPLQLLKK